MSTLRPIVVSLIVASAVILSACAVTPSAPGQPSPAATGAAPTQPAATATEQLTVYSGREEKLVAPLIARFTEETGVQVQVRYGDTAELAATILEEGANSPADVYFAQDAGALGALSAAQRLTVLPDDVLGRVDDRFRAPSGEWVGISGRARVVVYNTDALSEADLPDSILGFTDPQWRGRIGWAPTNGSFQSFVTALRLTQGEEVARQWLEGIQANQPKVYKNNTAIVTAVGAGEVEVGFVNHYYLYRIVAERGEGFPAGNYHPRGGDAGAMVNVAGVGILRTSDNQAAAERFVAYLLTDEAQRYFSEQTFEYPLVTGIEADPRLVPLDEIQAPEIDLGNLADLERTLELLQETGVI